VSLTQVLDQRPELARDKDPRRRGLISTSRSGSWIKAQQSPSFCFIPPDSSRQDGRERAQGRAFDQFGNALMTFDSALTEKTPEKIDVFEDGQGGIEILPKPCGM